MGCKKNVLCPIDYFYLSLGTLCKRSFLVTILDTYINKHAPSPMSNPNRIDDIKIIEMILNHIDRTRLRGYNSEYCHKKFLPILGYFFISQAREKD